MMSTIFRRSIVLVAAACLAGSANWPALAVAQEEPDDRAGAERPSQRPMLGIRYWHAGGGVLVGDVIPGSPAERAGIRIGDRIVSVNGHPLTEPLEDEEQREFPDDLSPHQVRLDWLVEATPEGDPVELEIRRGRETLSFEVVPEVLEDYDPEFFWYGARWPDPTYDSVAERLRDAMEQARFWGTPEDFVVGWVPPSVPAGRVSDDPGFSVPPVGVTRTVRLIDAGEWWRDRFRYVGGNLEMVQLNPELGAYFGTEEGVLVLAVDEDVTLGLRPGDVVVSIGGRQVDDVSDLQRILASYEEDEAVDFGIWRHGARATVVGTIR